MLCKTLLPPSNTLLYCTLYNSAQVSLPPFRIESVLGYNHLGSNPELFFIPLPSWIKKRAVTVTVTVRASLNFVIPIPACTNGI